MSAVPAPAAGHGKILWLNGYQCCGKTFIGDYLQTIGWVNIDGDAPTRSKDPADKELWKNMVAACQQWKEGMELPDEALWRPHIQNLLNQAVKLSQQGQNACVSFIVHKKYVRDWIREQCPAVHFVMVHVDADILVNKCRERTEKAVKAHGMSIEDWWGMQDPTMEQARQKYGDEYSPERCQQWTREAFYVGMEDVGPAEPNSHTINNNTYSKDSLERVRELCGIAGDFEYDVAAIEAVQMQRYAAIPGKNTGAGDKTEEQKEGKE